MQVALRRGDAAYCGLIGSLTKRRRFEKRLRQQGLSQRAIEQLVCPIGVTGISGKKPAEIAVAVAAEMLSRQFGPLDEAAGRIGSGGCQRADRALVRRR